MEAKESLLLVLSGGVLMSGGVVLFLCCLGLELTLHNCKGSIKNKFCCIFYKQQAIYLFLGLQGRESRVREPRGEEVLLVEVEEEQVLTGGLVTGSGHSSPSWLSSLELLELSLDWVTSFRELK